jgi:hypothetical protein
VPPGTYNHKNGIDELLNKKVSMKGPYDLFSENRNTIKWGHFAEQKNNNLGPGQYEFHSFTNDLNHSTRSKHGKFGKIAQYPSVSSDRISIFNQSLRPRNPTWPGPGAYSPIELSKIVSHNSPPFLVASGRSDHFLSSVRVSNDCHLN